MADICKIRLKARIKREILGDGIPPAAAQTSYYCTSGISARFCMRMLMRQRTALLFAARSAAKYPPMLHLCSSSVAGHNDVH